MPIPPPTEHFAKVWEALADWLAPMTAGVPLIAADIRAARVVYLIGNGGSQACAEHWATDFHKVLQHSPHGCPVFVAPAANAGLLTMLANDYGYDQVYANATAAARDDDVVIALSTSGRSANLLNQRIEWAIAPEGSPLARGVKRAISGRIYPPAALEDVFSILGHAIAEELRT